MKLFGFNITRTAPAPTTRSLSPEALAWLAGSDPAPYTPSLTDPFSQITWVYRAASVLAEQIANIPFLFSRGERGRENLITSGPLLDFYDQPHPHINRFQYWELRVLWLLLRGECFRIPIYSDSSSFSSSSSSSIPSGSSSRITHHASLSRNNPSLHHSTTPSARKRLRSVLILNPDHFQPVIQNHALAGWRYTGFPRSTPLESQVFLPEEVWHDKLPNPFDFWRGLSPLSSASLAMHTDHAAAAFMRGFIENNADNGIIVRTSDHLDDTQKEQLKAALNNRKRRAGCADRPLLLWNSCEVIKPTLSSADLQFLENRKFSRAEICSALGVPEEIVSTTDHNKYDVMQGARLNFIENRVAPLCARLEADENATTIPAIINGASGSLSTSPRPSDGRGAGGEGSSVVGWFDLDSLPIMQQARRNRITTAKLGFDMGIPFNELNRVLDLGFQSLPHGNNCYLPTNVQPVGTLSPSSSSSFSSSSSISGRSPVLAAPKSDEGGSETLSERSPAASNGSGTAPPSPIQNGRGIKGEGYSIKNREALLQLARLAREALSS